MKSLAYCHSMVSEGHLTCHSTAAAARILENPPQDTEHEQCADHIPVINTQIAVSHLRVAVSSSRTSESQVK